MNTCVNSRLLFVEFVKDLFKRKIDGHKTPFQAMWNLYHIKLHKRFFFRYLDVQVCRCVLQIPLCTMTTPHHFFASLMVEGIFAEIHCK